MEEIKETKTKKIIKFLLDNIMIISVIIFLCVLLFSSCSTAKASGSYEYKEEEYFNSCLEYFVELYGSDDTLLNTLKENLNYNMDFVFLEKDNATYSSGNIKYCIIFTDSNPSVCYPLSRSRSSSFSTGLTTNNASVWVDAAYTAGYIPCNMYYLIQSSNNQISFYKTYYSGIAGNNTASWANTRTDTTYFGNTTLILNYSNYCLSYNHYNYGADRQYELYGLPEYDLTAYSTDITELVPFRTYVEDSRLRMYITNAIGGPRLNVNVVDFAKSFPYPDQTVLQPKEITLTIETDGVESLYKLDPSTAIWASKYWATVPVADIAVLDGHDVVKITKVQFSMYEAFANMTEDFYIATDFALKDTTEEIDPSTILPPENIYEDAKLTAQIDLLVQTLEANGSGSVYGDFTFQSSIPVLPSWSDEIYTDLTRMEDTSSAFAGHWYDHYPWSFGDLQINPVEYINEFCEGYASVYDVIIFRVYGWMLDTSFSSDNPTIGSYSTGVKGYIVLYTNKFYNHSTSLTSLDILTVLQSDFNQQKSNWNWLVSKINDFESKSLEVMNAELRVERDSRDWLKSIWNQIENLEMPIYDDSDLLDKLDLIISEIDEIAGFFTGESGEGYNSFTEWLEKIENDGEITPHEWANEIFNYVTGLYHSISDGTAFYTNDITDYINYVNQNGTSDPGNYFFAMLEGTYNPHRYNGWTGGS